MGRNIDDFDRDAEEVSEARVFNVSDDVVRFEIAQGPGSKPRRYKLQPWGKPDSSVHLQLGYTIETKGVGRKMIMPTIEQLTEREVYPRGPRMPMVVSEQDGRAAAARERWVTALANRGKEAPKVIVMHTADGERVEAQLQHQHLPAKAKDDHGETEDQAGGALDPDPDHDPANTPDPSLAVPTVPMRARGGAKRKAG
jgi:hypothetical protein